MVSVRKKKFVVSDWFHRVETFEVATINQAVTEFLGAPAILVQDQNSSDAFASELTEELEKELQSQKQGEEQSNALSAFPGVKYFEKRNP